MPSNYQGFIKPNGEIRIFDPDFTAVRLIQTLNPGYQVRSDPPPRSFRPLLQRTRTTMVPRLSLDDLEFMDSALLWDLHDQALDRRDNSYPDAPGEVTLLDLKRELTAREFQACRLCGWNCGVNRFERPGRCGLRDEAWVSRLYVHPAEEPPITPTAVIELYGCALKCRGCHKFEILPVPNQGERLDPGTWRKLKSTLAFDKAVAVQLVGGNPDESALSALDALAFAPDLALPLVWNTHGYGTPTLYRLLDGVVDAFLPDFKFGPGRCCEQYAGIKDYWQVATAGIQAMARQRARIIVRVLVLPGGHVRCCHEPTLEWLGAYRDRIWLSFIEFAPFWRAVNDPKLGHCTSADDMDYLRGSARRLGLRTVDQSTGRFWTEPVRRF